MDQHVDILPKLKIQVQGFHFRCYDHFRRIVLTLTKWILFAIKQWEIFFNFWRQDRRSQAADKSFASWRCWLQSKSLSVWTFGWKSLSKLQMQTSSSWWYWSVIHCDSLVTHLFQIPFKNVPSTRPVLLPRLLRPGIRASRLDID